MNLLFFCLESLTVNVLFHLQSFSMSVSIVNLHYIARFHAAF